VSCGSCPVCQMCSGGVCVADASQEDTCCNGPSGQEWCQGGACVAVPASGSFADCQGYCDNSVNICGQTMGCPDCAACGCGGISCTAFSGPFGQGLYCRQAGSLGSCTTIAPCPSGQVCCGLTCRAICST
jgi:hypothetical protein